MIACTFENGNKARLRHVVADCVVLDGDKVFMVKRSAHLVEGGKWAIVGGYIEHDEVVIDGVRREVLEESGYEVGDLTLLTIVDNPKRPGDDRQNVSFVYFAEIVRKAGPADDESDAQEWFPLDALPPRDQIAFDHYELVQFYRAYRQKTFQLPQVGTTLPEGLLS